MLRPESVAERMLTNAKQRAKRKGSYVSISKEWILERIIKGKCEVTGLDFTLGGGYGSGRSSFNSFNPSLDRIDPNRGYSPENSRVVVNVYNTTKHRWNDQDVLVYCKALLGRTFDYYLSDVENNMRFKTLRGLAYSRYIKAKRTAKEKILDFNISIDWVEERIKRGICEITNLRFVTNIPYHPFQPSLDKIDPMKGYTTENTRVVVYIHNWGRQRSSDQDMMILAKSLIK
ncbi:MAG: hypothetical protein CL764_01690 [Chloroflexi bacterium]|nr:hypothetical protein [Chloroflexota bacterium]